MRLARSSGVLLHVTSLPGGRLGPDAYRFVDWLHEAGQSWWQVLPLGPPDRHSSPYRASSAFAAWPGLVAEPEARVEADEIERFVARHPYWSGDWAAFAGEGAIADQVRFEREWGALRAYAATRGIRIMGDLPIYVAAGSADHRAHPELFVEGAVAGVPPDDWSASGQLWGNPLYDWRAMHVTGYRWWVERLRRSLELVDLIRIDHFRALVAYWEVPARAKDARSGAWRRGPGRQLLDAARAALGDLPLVAENLGVITPPVERLRRELRLPGMIVLHFALQAAAGNPTSLGPDEDQSAVYTGTHDNDTSAGWWASAPEAVRRRARRAFAAHGIEEDEPAWALVRLALCSRGPVAILPMQDVLGLGSEARMNTPGRERGNWRWRLRGDELTAALAARLREATADAGRLGDESGERRRS